MTNLYVKLDDVNNHYLASLGCKYTLDGLNDINELPTIDLSEDKTIQTIDEMIEKFSAFSPSEMWGEEYKTGFIHGLKTVKSRLYPNK